jgi:hypothetical protein
VRKHRCGYTLAVASLRIVSNRECIYTGLWPAGTTSLHHPHPSPHHPPNLSYSHHGLSALLLKSLSLHNPTDINLALNMQFIASALAVSAFLSSNVVAHPGQSSIEMRAEMAERAAFMQYSKKDLSHCAAKMKARGLEARSLARREAIAKNARKKRDIAAGMKSYIDVG